MTHVLFFFQAEDGIRDGHVTGVQTCALPISGETDRIPSFDSGESFSAASWVRTRCDIFEARNAVAIQPGIEEPERVFTLSKQEVIKQCDYARHDLCVTVSRGLENGQHREGGGKDVRVPCSSYLQWSIISRRKLSRSAALARRRRGSRGSKRCTKHKVRTGQAKSR